jgi:hypothetical protein
VMLCAPVVSMADDFHGQEAASRSSRFQVETVRPLWPNGIINFRYNPANQPVGLTTEAVENLLRAAGQKWADVCNVRFNYLGTTTLTANIDAVFSTLDRVNVVGWGPLTGNRAGFDAYTTWWWSNPGPVLVDSDVLLNTNAGARLASRPSDLGALLTHEFGHVLAIKHSDVRQAVMYANPYNSYAFQSTLRGDDAQACISLYGPAPASDVDRVFNWAEQTYRDFFFPSGSTSLEANGIRYRFFPGSNSYLGLYNGGLYYYPVGSDPVPLGNPAPFVDLAKQASF